MYHVHTDWCAKYVCLHNTVFALICVGFNMCVFHGSAAIREYFVNEYLNITVNGHV